MIYVKRILSKNSFKGKWKLRAVVYTMLLSGGYARKKKGKKNDENSIPYRENKLDRVGVWKAIFSERGLFLVIFFCFCFDGFDVTYLCWCIFRFRVNV